MSLRLFNSMLRLKTRDQAISTIFITEMAQGTLPLDQYRMLSISKV